MLMQWIGEGADALASELELLIRHKLLLAKATSYVCAGQVVDRGLFRKVFRCFRESHL